MSWAMTGAGWVERCRQLKKQVCTGSQPAAFTAPPDNAPRPASHTHRPTPPHPFHAPAKHTPPHSTHRPNTERTVSALAAPSMPPIHSLVVGSALAPSCPPGRGSLSSLRRPLQQEGVE